MAVLREGGLSGLKPQTLTEVSPRKPKAFGGGKIVLYQMASKTHADRSIRLTTYQLHNSAECMLSSS